MSWLLKVLFLSTTSLLLSGGDDAVQKELKSLAGKWKAVALEADGMQLPKESVPSFFFIVEADGKAKGQMGKTEYRSKISVDPAKSPRTITNAHETGQHQGKKQFGVYKLEGDKWIVCMTAPGAAESDQPKTFDTKGSKNVLFTFEKVKDDK